jgi:hypothetical protein
MSSTERVRRFRERLRARLGDEKYKELTSEQQREYRAKLRQGKLAQLEERDKDSVAKITEQLQDLVIDTWDEFKSEPIKIETKKTEIKNVIANIKSFKNCDELIEAIQEAEAKNGRKIKNSTIRANVKIISLIYRRFKKEKTFPCSSKAFEIFRDTDKIINFIEKEWTKPATRIAKYTALAGIMRSMSGWEVEQKVYSQLGSRLQSSNQEAREEQKLTKKQKENILPWNEIVAKGKGIKDLFEKAIYSMYTLIPPRRVATYYDLTLRPVGYEPPKNFSYAKDEGQNVLLVDKKWKPQTMILQRFKTAVKLGEYETKVPENLAKILQAYIKDEVEDGGMEMGSVIFPKLNGKRYSKGGYTQLATGIFKKYLNRNIGTTFLRISFASNIINHRPAYNIREKKAFAWQLGHTESQLQLYGKLDLVDEDF